eukprot:COSAG01_NODE_1071_length_11863_cov_36.887623_3_plen_36_part_00
MRAMMRVTLPQQRRNFSCKAETRGTYVGGINLQHV